MPDVGSPIARRLFAALNGDNGTVYGTAGRWVSQRGDGGGAISEESVADTKLLVERGSAYGDKKKRTRGRR
jgi:hypothetical protein